MAVATPLRLKVEELDSTSCDTKFVKPTLSTIVKLTSLRLKWRSCPDWVEGTKGEEGIVANTVPLMSIFAAIETSKTYNRN
jgi:hypothetical protein